MSFLSLALAVVAGAQSQSLPLNHEFKKGEKLAYQVMSHITAENRGKNLDTWIPQDLDLNYNFTYTVSELRADGIAVVHYDRPTMTEVSGETAESPPVEHVEKTDLNYQLTVSPINEILEEKDLSKKGNNLTAPLRSAFHQGAMSFFAPFISNMHRLALFVGGVDDSLDFSPKFSLSPVKVGDTWKKTVGFEPQKLKGKSKSAVQRIDYTYTYLGPMTVGGKSILRVEAKLKFVTDAAEFFKQILADHASETDVVKVPLHFESTIDFDLDPNTRDLLSATGTTEGGYQVFITEAGDDAATEERFKGKTTVALTGKRIVTGTKG